MKKEISVAAIVRFFPALFLFLSLSVWGQPVLAENFITLGTGGITGVYFPTGGAICQLVNENREQLGLRCSTESTQGSVYNLETIRTGGLDLGVVQSDWQFHATKGSGQFQEAGPDEELRAVFSIHPEPFTVVARKDAGITKLAELKGKRINIGNPGSGQRGTMEVVMKVLGWATADFTEVTELKSAEQAHALCDNSVDVIIFTVGHPSASIQEASTACESVLVEVSGPEIDQLVTDNPFYSVATIPGGLYQGNPDPVKTFGVRATLVSSTKTPADTVYGVVKSVFDNFERFTTLHPAFSVLNKTHMTTLGLSAPLHDGATRYYKDAGLMK